MVGLMPSGNDTSEIFQWALPNGSSIEMNKKENKNQET
jgi:hypothetical protein